MTFNSIRNTVKSLKKIRSLLFITLLILSFVFTKEPFENSYVVSDNDNLDTSSFINRIISVLGNEAIYEFEKLQGWPERKNGLFESNERWYRGYQVGLAGIADFLLEASLQGYSSADDLLNQSIKHFIDEKTISPNVGIYWKRYANSDSAGWLGHRYGTSGILKFITHALNKSYVSNIDDLISNAFIWLKDKQLEDGSWPMTEGGYITTGREYGGAGIAMDFLDIYSYLNNETFLQEAINIGEWLINDGVWEDNRFRIAWSPQELGSEFDEIYLTGLGTGQAGILDLMLNLYNRTGEEKFLTTAIGLGYQLVEMDMGGFWPDGSVSYITKIYYGNHALTGYLVGASGIALQLLKLFDLTGDTVFLKHSARVEKFIEGLLDENGTIPIGLDYQNNRFTGLSLGSAGIALYYLELYEYFGFERHYKNAINILSNLYNLMIPNELIPVDQEEKGLGYSFNIEDGLAGIGLVLLKLNKINKGSHQNKYDVYFSTIVPSSIYTINYLQSTSSNSDAPIRIYSALLILLISFNITRKRKID